MSSKKMNRRQEYQALQLGLTIAFYRKLRGMTQLQLAEAADISRTYLSNIEAPYMPVFPSLSALFRIAEALDVPANRLLKPRE